MICIVYIDIHVFLNGHLNPVLDLDELLADNELQEMEVGIAAEELAAAEAADPEEMSSLAPLESSGVPGQESENIEAGGSGIDQFVPILSYEKKAPDITPQMQ